MAKEHCLAELLKTTKKPLTKRQWNNFGALYMGMTNDDKLAADVDIGPVVRRRVKEISEKGTYRR